jgi:hypothetical protein
MLTGVFLFSIGPAPAFCTPGALWALVQSDGILPVAELPGQLRYAALSTAYRK